MRSSQFKRQTNPLKVCDSLIPVMVEQLAQFVFTVRTVGRKIFGYLLQTLRPIHNSLKTGCMSLP